MTKIKFDIGDIVYILGSSSDWVGHVGTIMQIFRSTRGNKVVTSYALDITMGSPISENNLVLIRAKDKDESDI
jgi:hypothetical protein